MAKLITQLSTVTVINSTKTIKMKHISISKNVRVQQRKSIYPA